MREIITSYEHVFDETIIAVIRLSAPQLDIVIANAGVSQGLAGVKDNENILEQVWNSILPWIDCEIDV